MSTDTTDYAPVGIVDDRDILFTNLRSGDVAATLTPIDWGLPTGGRWVIDEQSSPGLFSIAYNPATDTTARLVVNNAALMPEAGSAATVTVHYYDRYQIDYNGNPLPGKGIAETLVYNFEAGATRDLDGFGAEFALGAAGAAANPDLAALSSGGFIATWQASASGGVIMGQLRDGSGAARGSAFAISSTSDGAMEGAPSVAALAGGRAVVAYTSIDAGGSHVAYRIVDGSGVAGVEVSLGGVDGTMPDVVALNDGSFAIAWTSGGQVHVRSADANGVLRAGEQVYGGLGTAFNPSIAANGAGYVVSWGEIGDGNVYAATAGGPAILVSGDGLAASIATAAPLPSVSALAGGGFVVAWDSYANFPWGFASSDIFFQRFDASGQRVGEMTQANIDGGGAHYEASVTALSDGGFAIAWQTQGGDFDGNGVFGRRFGADGTPADLREFAINEMRQGDQANPVLAALGNGGLAAAWIDTQVDGAAQVEARVLAGSAQLPATPPSAMTPDATVNPVPVPTPTPAPAPAPSGSAGGSGGGVGGGGVKLPVSGSSGGSAGSMGGSGAAGGTPVATLVLGRHGADMLKAAAGNQKIDALDGLDTVEFAGYRGFFDITRGASGATVVDRQGSGGTDTLLNVERLQFADASVALDIDGAAGQAYRLYRAAFDRAPDKVGLGYWINALDQGHSLEAVAASFANSKEFADLYGAHTSDAQFVDLLYQNTLHRAPDAGGRDFWLDVLENGSSREYVLGRFSESPENQAQVIGSIANGIEFTAWIW